MTSFREGNTAKCLRIIRNSALTLPEKVVELFRVSTSSAVESGTRMALRRLYESKGMHKEALALRRHPSSAQVHSQNHSDQSKNDTETKDQ